MGKRFPLNVDVTIHLKGDMHNSQLYPYNFRRCSILKSAEIY